MQVLFGEFVLDDALGRFDFETCHVWLNAAYWSKGITRFEVERGFRHSTLVVGAYQNQRQVGCLRVASDRTRFAYLMDLYVAQGFRSRGLGTALTRFALAHPELAPVTKWLLGTKDAHALYNAVGFRSLTHPERLMSLERPRPWLEE